mmetsp:Transcript_10568/g.29340  ORF Transcript_10568/g.29340 Transcript_10568/m.29340 type:complete len:267 (-) Transcript_10568:35-835(-)
MLEPERGLSCPERVLPLVHLQGRVCLIIEARAVHLLQLPVLLLEVGLSAEVLQHFVSLAVPCQRTLPVLVRKGLVALGLDLLTKIKHTLDFPFVKDLLPVGGLAINTPGDAVGLDDHLVHQVLLHLFLGLPPGNPVRPRSDLSLDSHQPVIDLRLPQLVAEEHALLPRLTQDLPQVLLGDLVPEHGRDEVLDVSGALHQLVHDFVTSLLSLQLVQFCPLGRLGIRLVLELCAHGGLHLGALHELVPELRLPHILRHGDVVSGNPVQ